MVGYAAKQKKHSHHSGPGHGGPGKHGQQKNRPAPLDTLPSPKGTPSQSMVSLQIPMSQLSLLSEPRPSPLRPEPPPLVPETGLAFGCFPDELRLCILSCEASVLAEVDHFLHPEDELPGAGGPCMSRWPNIHDVVTRIGGRTVVLDSQTGRAMAWRMRPREPATIVQVNAEGAIKLRNAQGKVSAWTSRKFFEYLNKNMLTPGARVRVFQPGHHYNGQHGIILDDDGTLALNLKVQFDNGQIRLHNRDDLHPERGLLEFQPGERVEYYSSTKGHWIEAQVLRANPEKTTYDLSTRKGVRPECVREMPLERRYQPGDTVEYHSSKHGDHMRTRVLKFNAHSETFDLGCRLNADPERMSVINPDTDHGIFLEFRPGQRVGYWNGAVKRWQESKVVRVNLDDATYDLDIRPHVQPNFVRELPLARKFLAGDLVSYVNQRGEQMDTQVIRFNPDSETFDLGAKLGAEPSRMRSFPFNNVDQMRSNPDDGVLAPDVDQSRENTVGRH